MKLSPKQLLTVIVPLIIGVIGGMVITTTLTITDKDGTTTEIKTIIEPATSLTLGEETTITEVENDLGEIVEETYPTVEEIDGGKFEDEDTGISTTEGQYADLGAIEEVDTSSPLAFKNSTLGRCIRANNIYGSQCVSLARAFWYDYAHRDVSTCGTGLAKGMMNCAEQNAGDDFEIIYDRSKIIAGTWVVTDGSYTGHICMALGTVSPAGYVACLGEHQGGTPCPGGGAATNIVNLSMKNFLGGYIPKTYIPVEPEPEVLPETSIGY